MAIIGMAVYSTPENGKDEYLEKTLFGLQQTVNFRKHKLMLSVNANTPKTLDIIGNFSKIISKVIYNHGNIGTAEAINKVWAFRKAGQHAVKMDDDIVISDKGWLDNLEYAVSKDSKIGQIGLKRKDLWEYPGNPNPDYKSELIMLPHIAGEPWVIVEKVKHCIGSCVLHSSDLLDKVGYLYQPSLYGYDDVIMSHRTHIAGFYSCFLPSVAIDHIDAGNTEYQDWKHKHSGEQTQAVINYVHELYNGTKDIFYKPESI